MSKPMAAISGNWRSTSLKVPCWPGMGEAERGNSSYHDGKPRPFAIDPNRQFGFKLRGVRQVRIARHQALKFLIARILVECALLAGQPLQIPRKLAQPAASLALRPRGCFAHQNGAG